MKKVFISGPYRADTFVGIMDNIDAAAEVAVKYWRKGHAVFCPHMNSAHLDGIVPRENFLKADLLFLEHCDIIVMMRKWTKSKGAVAEFERAVELGIEVIYEDD